MGRLTGLCRLLVVVLSVVVVWCVEGGAKPNVLLIGVDDLRVELGCYGDTVVQSPRIDGLARRGTLFGRAYCQQAVCNPSRASMMTGLRPDTLGIWELKTAFRQNYPDVVTLPQLFKEAGYETRGIGKIFHNWGQDEFKGDPISWSAPEVMHYASHSHDVAEVDGGGKAPVDLATAPRTEMRDVDDEAYFDGRIAKLAVEALGEIKEEPFFLAVGFWKPHLPFNAPRKYWDLYDRAEIGAPVNPEAPVGVPEIAMHDSRELLREYKGRPGGKPTAEDVLALRHGYYAAVSYVDAQIGKVLDELDRLGLRENTIVVFYSDHGFHLGEQDLWAKTSNFELDARVPLVIATPWDEGGVRSESLVELVDVYPTLADLCGLEAPGDLEGVSLAGVLGDADVEVKDAAFTQHPRPAYPPRGGNPTAMGYSMRMGTYRYTEWRDFESGELIVRELYDHEVDGRETRNVAEESGRGEVLGKLEARLGEQFPREPARTKIDAVLKARAAEER